MRTSTRWLLAAGCLLGTALPPATALAQKAPGATARPAVPVQQALDELGRIYGTKFVYESALISGRTTAVRVVPGRSVADLLKAILYPNGLLFLYVDPTHYTIVAKDQAQTTAPAGGSTPEGLPQADTRTISGIVQDEQGQPLPGATVLAGTSGAVGGATNAAGRFLLRISASALGARVSSIGYEDQAFVLGAQSYYTITLRTQAVGLKPVEVVSTGYESLPRERATGSFGLVTSEQLEQIPVPNVVQRLEGQVAGVQLNIQESWSRASEYGRSRRLRLSSSLAEVRRCSWR
jgi:hypothetical protein